MTDTKHSPEFAQLLAANEHNFELAQVLAAVDDVERLEEQAGLADEHAGARRELLERFGALLLGACRTWHQRQDTLKHLTAAVRVRQPSPAISPGEEISRCERTLIQFKYNGCEIDALRSRLKTNEPIGEILPRGIVTDRRTIDRASLHGGRPVSFTNERAWRNQFPSEEVIAEVEAQYKEEQEMIVRRRAQDERSARDAEIARQQAEAARVRRIEAYEDAVLATVKRAEQRHKAST